MAELTAARLIGSTLVSDSGSTLMLLRPGGVELCSRLVEGASGPFTGAEFRLVARLARRGLVRLAAPPGRPAPAVSAVVPALDSAGVSECLASLARIPEVTEVVLVSDGSPQADQLADLAATRGARFVALQANHGPAAARNAGAALAGGEILLFLDSDAAALPGLSQLLRLFASPKLSLAAPRIRSQGREAGHPLAAALAGYEALHSPLDMGPLPGEAGISPRYLPAACLAVRAADFQNLGGFDERLRYGEDVDLLWRLRKRGGIAYYSGSDGATHLVRSTLGAFLRQRFSYGTSAAALVKRHPGMLKHLFLDEVTVALAAFPLAGAALRLATLADARRRLCTSAGRAGIDIQDLPSPSREVVTALAAEISMLVRALGAPVIALAGFSARLRNRLATLLGLLAVARVLQAAQAGAALPRTLATGVISVLDDLAYSAGLARGCAAKLSLAPYKPELHTGPLLSRLAHLTSRATARKGSAEGSPPSSGRSGPR